MSETYAQIIFATCVGGYSKDFFYIKIVFGSQKSKKTFTFVNNCTLPNCTLMKRKLPYILNILLRSKMDLPYFLEITKKTWIRIHNQRKCWIRIRNKSNPHQIYLGRGEPLKGTLKNLENDDLILKHTVDAKEGFDKLRLF